jgi:energy-coupling factor transport system ATP-binding protein
LSDVALEVTKLWFWYSDETAPALRGIDLTVQTGEFVVLVGANGSGKTTLTKHLNGLLRPRRGQVRILGRDSAGRSTGELARSVGYLFQHPEQQIFASTVEQEIAFGPRNLGLNASEVQARLETALLRFDLMAVASRPPAILGYGARRKITLASLAAMDPPVLVLDEPTVGLDAVGRRETLDWLVELHQLGRTILLVTHDMALAARYAGRIVVLQEGRIAADSPPRELFRQTRLLAQASLDLPPVTALDRALSSMGTPGDSLSIEDFCDAYLALIQRPGQPPANQSASSRHGNGPNPRLNRPRPEEGDEPTL